MNVSPRRSILLDIMGGKDFKLYTFGRWLKKILFYFFLNSIFPPIYFFNDNLMI